MGKRLYKSQNRVLCGVCGGIADFFNIDPTIVRIIMIVLVVAGFGTGIVIYILAALIMPDRPIDDDRYYRNANVNNFDNRNCDNNYKQHNADAHSSYNERQAGSSSEAPNSDSDFDNYFKKNN